jgi:hypothetical protein
MEFIRCRTVHALLGYRIFKVTNFFEVSIEKIKSEGAGNYS